MFGESGFFDPGKPIRDFTKKELDDFLYGAATKVKINGINLTYQGLVPKIQQSMLSRTSTRSSRTFGRLSSAP